MLPLIDMFCTILSEALAGPSCLLYVMTAGKRSEDDSAYLDVQRIAALKFLDRLPGFSFEFCVDIKALFRVPVQLLKVGDFLYGGSALPS